MINPLTPRETDVLVAYVNHGPAKNAARELGMAFRTFKVHLANIHEKLECGTTTRAAVMLYPLLHERYDFPGILEKGIDK